MHRRTTVVTIVLLVVFTAACRPPWRSRSRDHAPFRATGYFRIAAEGARSWLVTPDGRPFYSTGINHLTATGNDQDRTTGACPYCEAIATYPAVDTWTDTALARLRTWGFNTLGTWSETDRFASRLPYTQLLGMAGTDDWFSPAFVDRADEIAAASVAPRRDDPNLIGWVTDSELRWGPDWRGNDQLLDHYLQLPPGAPGRAVAEAHTGDPRGFLSELATQYFRVTTTAIRAQDPNHLILGIKQITQLTPPEVLEAARPYVDVFSVDDYELIPGLEQAIHDAQPMYLPRDPSFTAIHDVVQRPIMVMEYSFRAADAGVPNSYPPIFPTLATQTERADALTGYVEHLYATPWVVGDHWFEYVDEPAGGRFDGEDSNFGLVDVHDAPWRTLVDRMAAVHRLAPDRVHDPGTRCTSWARRSPIAPVRCVSR